MGGTEVYKLVFRNGQCLEEDDAKYGLTLGLAVHPNLIKALEPWF